MKYDDQHSQLVEQAALVARARPGVIDLTLHPPSVYYTDAEGKKQRHVFDFVVVLDTGRKVAVTVISKAREHEVVAVLQAVNKAGAAEVESGRLKRRLFDFARTWTELETTPDQVANARAILASREGIDADDCLATSQLASSFRRPFRFHELFYGCDDIDARRMSVWRLIDLELLKPPVPGLPINDQTLFRHL